MDEKAKKVSLSFPGGSVRTTIGLIEAIWGNTKLQAAMQPIAKTVNKKSHGRTRVIGKSGVGVRATTYTQVRYPSGEAGGPAGGEPIKILVGNRWWTMRLTGNHNSFCQFLGGVTTPEQAGSGAIYWKSNNGKSYGPFRKP